MTHTPILSRIGREQSLIWFCKNASLLTELRIFSASNKNKVFLFSSLDIEFLPWTAASYPASWMVCTYLKRPDWWNNVLLYCWNYARIYCSNFPIIPLKISSTRIDLKPGFLFMEIIHNTSNPFRLLQVHFSLHIFFLFCWLTLNKTNLMTHRNFFDVFSPPSYFPNIFCRYAFKLFWIYLPQCAMLKSFPYEIPVQVLQKAPIKTVACAIKHLPIFFLIDKLTCSTGK